MRWAGSGSPSSRVRSVITSWMSRLMPAGRGVSDGSRSAWSVTVPVVPAAGCGRPAWSAVAGFGSSVGVASSSVVVVEVESAVGDGLGVPADGLFGVQPVGVPGGLGRGAPVAQLRVLLGQGLVDLAAVVAGEQGGFPDGQDGAVFAGLAGGQGAVQVRHLVDQGAGQADVFAAVHRGVVAGEGDLGVDAAAQQVQFAGGRRGAAGPVVGVRVGEGVGGGGLQGGPRGVQAFELVDDVDQFGLLDAGPGAPGVGVDGGPAQLADQFGQLRRADRRGAGGGRGGRGFGGTVGAG